MRGSQWDKWEIRVSGRELKMIGIKMIKEKKGIQ
jgi:hypothetical protein